MRKKNTNPLILAAVLAAVLIALTLTVNVVNAEPREKKSRLNPDHEEFYKYARYLFTKNERKIFLNLPTDEARDRFIRYFWEIRDPNPYTEENEFKLEIERRYEYATKFLKEGPIAGWKSDRGRIYILLGAPTNKMDEHPTPGTGYFAAVYWYYADSDIYARFIDKNGTGIYLLDHTFVSLRLLSELERRKYYIVNEDNEKFAADVLDFDLTYDSGAHEVRIDVDTENLNYEKAPDSDGERMTAKIKVELIVYDNKNEFFKHSEVKTVTVPKADLLNKRSKVTVKIALKLPPGKVKIDALITDLFGDSINRKFVKIKN